MRSNEFTGVTLYEAARKATAVYRNGATDRKDFCSGLRSQYDSKLSELDQIQREIGDLQEEIEALRRAAARANLTSLVLAAGTAARAVTKWRGIINLIKRLKLDKHVLDAILRNGPEAATAVSAGITALFAVREHERAEKLAREISRLQARSDRIIERMEELARSHLNGNCHLQNLQS